MSSGGLAAMLMLVALPHPVRAVIRVHPSLEWLCECMPHVAVVEVRLPPDASDPGRVGMWTRAHARTRQVLKGDPPDSSQVGCWAGLRFRPGGRTSLLAFFDAAHEVKCAIALDDSQSCYKPAVTRDLRVLRRKQEILAVALPRLEAMRQEGRTTPRERLVIDVPVGSRAFKVLTARSAVFLEIPADPEYHPVLLGHLRSRSWQVREGAAHLLAKYPGPETVAALRALLMDLAVDSTTHLGPASEPRGNTPYFPVRQAAYLALRELGVEVDPPAGYLAELPSGDRRFRVFPSKLESPSRR